MTGPAWLVLPTFNEAENLETVVAAARRVLGAAAPDGFRVLIDPASVPIVQGSTLEFHDALLGGGLKMLNPQAVHECACGESFGI